MFVFGLDSWFLCLQKVCFSSLPELAFSLLVGIYIFVFGVAFLLCVGLFCFAGLAKRCTVTCARFVYVVVIFVLLWFVLVFGIALICVQLCVQLLVDLSSTLLFALVTLAFSNSFFFHPFLP